MKQHVDYVKDYGVDFKFVAHDPFNDGQVCLADIPPYLMGEPERGKLVAKWFDENGRRRIDSLVNGLEQRLENVSQIQEQSEVLQQDLEDKIKLRLVPQLRKVKGVFTIEPCFY